MSDRPKILYFSRGKGRGHAFPDAAIVDELRRREPSAEVTFASYGTGARTLEALGCGTIDLDLPEDNPIWDTTVKAVKLIEDVAPTLVVSHEECFVVPIAKGMGLPTVFLTDWFGPADTVNMQALKFADEVVFLDDAGYQDVPRHVTDRIVYVGAVLRNGLVDGPGILGRDECRALLGLPPRGLTLVVIPGGAMLHSEALAPILDLVLRAYDGIDDPDKRLVWVAGGIDHALVSKRASDRPDIIVMKPHGTIARTMRAASVVITKANRMTTLECEAVGVPSISISFGNNPPDDNRVARIRSNTALRAKGLEPDVLRQCVSDSLSVRAPGIPPEVLSARCRAVADRLQHHLQLSATPIAVAR
jgi:UDP-N-acetylglucosamine:LPS N-acetylglucosamine transferase